MNLMAQKFYIDPLYNIFIAKSVAFFGYIQYILLDRGILEKIGPYGITEIILSLTKKLKFQSTLNLACINGKIVSTHSLLCGGEGVKRSIEITGLATLVSGDRVPNGGKASPGCKGQDDAIRGMYHSLTSRISFLCSFQCKISRIRAVHEPQMEHFLYWYGLSWAGEAEMG